MTDETQTFCSFSSFQPVQSPRDLSFTRFVLHQRVLCARQGDLQYSLLFFYVLHLWHMSIYLFFLQSSLLVQIALLSRIRTRDKHVLLQPKGEEEGQGLYKQRTCLKSKMELPIYLTSYSLIPRYSYAQDIV